MIDSRTKATAAGLVSRVCAESALATIWSAMSDMPPERASLARLGSASRVASDGSASAPNSVSEATSAGSSAAILWQTMVPIEWPTKCAFATPRLRTARDHRAGHRFDRQRLERPRRTRRARQVDADDAIAAEHRQLRLEQVGRAAEAVDHDDGKAVALDFRNQRSDG